MLRVDGWGKRVTSRVSNGNVSTHLAGKNNNARAFDDTIFNNHRIAGVNGNRWLTGVETLPVPSRIRTASGDGNGRLVGDIGRLPVCEMDGKYTQKKCIKTGIDDSAEGAFGRHQVKFSFHSEIDEGEKN